MKRTIYEIEIPVDVSEKDVRAAFKGTGISTIKWITKEINKQKLKVRLVDDECTQPQRKTILITRVGEVRRQ